MDKLLDSDSDKRQLALLQFDGIILGIAQKEILTSESLAVMNTRLTTEKSSGTLLYAAAEIPVYSFNHKLMLLDHPISTNRLCITIKHPNNKESFAITCDSVDHYNVDKNINISSLPPLIKTPNSPIIGMLNKDSKLVLIVCAESIRTYINSQELENA